MARTSDWDRIKYEFGLYARTPAAKRHAIIAASLLVLAIGVFVTRALLPRTIPHAAPPAAEQARSGNPVPAGLSGPSAFARRLESRIRDDARFRGRVSVVPVSAVGDGRVPGVLVQGRLPAADLEALRGIAAALPQRVPIEWRVAARDAPDKP